MTDRFKLQGTYRTPRFRIGAKVKCRVRGELTIVGITHAPIPWPLGKYGRGAKSLVVYGDLVRAVRRGSVSAICHWFGVHSMTVWKWRKALGVPERNYGTRKLWEVSAAAGSYWNGIRAGIAKARDPIRRAKIAAANRGKRRPQTVVEKVRRAHLGVKARSEDPPQDERGVEATGQAKAGRWTVALLGRRLGSCAAHSRGCRLDRPDERRGPLETPCARLFVR